MTGPTTFRLRPEGFEADRRKRLRALVGRLAVMTAIVVGVEAFVLRGNLDAIGFSLVTLAIVALVIAVAVRRRIARWRAQWSTFEVVITEDDLTRSVQGYPTLRIPRSNVSGIDEAPEGLSVRAGKLTAVWLPRAIDGYDLLRERLSTWSALRAAVPVSRAVVWTLSALGGGWVLAMFALEHAIARKGVEGAILEIALLELLALGLLVYTLLLRTLESRVRRTLSRVALMAMIAPLLLVGLQRLGRPGAPPPIANEPGVDRSP